MESVATYRRWQDTINRSKTRENAREELAEFKARLNRAQEDAGVEGSMSPIYFLEDWPRCIIFFMRMLQILRGLCVAVDAEGMPLLEIFSSHAREALQEGSRLAEAFERKALKLLELLRRYSFDV